MRIALAQTTTGIDPERNATTLVDVIAAAADDGAKVIFTPEMSGLIDRDRERAARHIVAEDDDAVLRAVRHAAAEHGIWVQLGSLAIRRQDGRVANRAYMIDCAGTVQARYDKLHLFDVDLPTGESWRESATYAAGDASVVVETPAGRVGLSICYDLRFPALYQTLAGAGATILAVPAAFTRSTGAAHWSTLLRARAIENAAFVVAAAQTGEHEDGRATYGHAMVVDPWGEVLADLGDRPQVRCVELDLARVTDARSRIPVLAHRRAIPEPR